MLICDQILAIRAQVEELKIDEESLAFIGEIGQQASLRFFSQFLFSFLILMAIPVPCYLFTLNATFIHVRLFRHAVQLLSPASIVAKMNGRDNICKVVKLKYNFVK